MYKVVQMMAEELDLNDAHRYTSRAEEVRSPTKPPTSRHEAGQIRGRVGPMQIRHLAVEGLRKGDAGALHQAQQSVVRLFFFFPSPIYWPSPYFTLYFSLFL